MPPLVIRLTRPAEYRTQPLHPDGSPLWSANAAVTAAPAVSVYGCLVMGVAGISGFIPRCPLRNDKREQQRGRNNRKDHVAPHRYLPMFLTLRRMWRWG